MNGNAMFFCQPAASVVTERIQWTVNDTSVEKFPDFTVWTRGTISQLLVTGCLAEWNGVHVQCVVITSAEVIYSNASLLLINTGET